MNSQKLSRNSLENLGVYRVGFLEHTQMFLGVICPQMTRQSGHPSLPGRTRRRMTRRKYTSQFLIILFQIFNFRRLSLDNRCLTYMEKPSDFALLCFLHSNRIFFSVLLPPFETGRIWSYSNCFLDPQSGAVHLPPSLCQTIFLTAAGM